MIEGSLFYYNILFLGEILTDSAGIHLTIKQLHMYYRILVLSFVIIVNSNQLFSQNVGIGTTVPQAYGHGGVNKLLEIRNDGMGTNIQSHVILSTGGTSGSLGTLTWAASNIPGTEKRTALIANLFETANATRLGFYTRNEAGLLAEKFSINSNGNIGIGTSAPTAPLSFVGNLGNKIALWGDASLAHYGLGIQGGLLQIYSDASVSNIAFGYGKSDAFTERMRIINNGGDGIELKGRIHLRNGTSPVDPAYGAGIWLYKADNTASLGFMGTQNNQNVGFYGGPVGWGFVYDAINSRVGIGNSTPINRLDVTGLNNWDLTNTEGDMRIGNATNRIKFGIALAGGGAGAAGIMQSGGIGTLNIGANNKNVMQVNGVGNFIDLTNLSGGIRFNGNAGTAGQILQSSGNSAEPKWIDKPYVLAYNLSTTVNLEGLGVFNLPLPGLDNQFFNLTSTCYLIVSISVSASTASVFQSEAGAYVSIYNISNQKVATVNAQGQISQRGTTLASTTAVLLPPGFYHTVSSVWRVGSDSGDSQIYNYVNALQGTQLIIQVLPQ